MGGSFLITSGNSPLPESKEWANDLLRYCIAFLRGKNVEARLSTRILVANVLKKRLAREGFWFQVKILDFWLNRARAGEFGS